ncbi:hypothetical protein BGW41_003094, partial [Actinomortierella wolfii]
TGAAATPVTPTTPGDFKHASLSLSEGAIASVLNAITSVASKGTSNQNSTTSASTGLGRRHPTRRFTVNASYQESQLALEQRKTAFLMEHITALQRGFEAIRQEKRTLELQLDLLQRQHTYQQQQRQRRRESQRRTLIQDANGVLTSAAHNATATATGTGGPHKAGTRTSVVMVNGRLSWVSPDAAAKATTQWQAQAQAQAEAERQAAAAAAEAALREKQVKDKQIKETLASLESNRSRSVSRPIPTPDSDEWKNLEHLRALAEQHMLQSQQQPSPDSYQQNSKEEDGRKGGRNRGSISPASLKSSSPSKSPQPGQQQSSSPVHKQVAFLRGLTSSYTQSEQQTPTKDMSQHVVQSLVAGDHIESCACCIGEMIHL